MEALVEKHSCRSRAEALQCVSCLQMNVRELQRENERLKLRCSLLEQSTKKLEE